MLTKVKIGLLRDAMAQASHTLDSRASSVGSWLHLMARPDKLYVYSTNLGMARTFIKIPAEVTKEGEALILPKLLQSILASLPAEDNIEIGLSASGAKLQVKYESIKSEIAVYADGPKATAILQTIPFNAKSCATVSTTALVDVINRVLFCAASSEGAISEGPWLSSLRLQVSAGLIMGIATNRIVAGQAEVLDGLATGDYTGAIHRGALLALKAILTKRKEEEVTITNVDSNEGSTNETLFRFSDVILGVRQLSKPYPTAVSKVFTTPEAFKTTRINRQILLSVFGRLGAFAEKNAFTITAAGNKMTLQSKGYNSNFTEQVALLDTVAESVTIGLGISDMMNVLTAAQSEDVTIRFKSNADHVHVQEGDTNFHYVLSPVTVEWEKKASK